MTSQLAQRPGSAVLTHGRGRGPGGQQSAGLLIPVGRCVVPGCEAEIDPTRLMCRDDWYRLPKRLRDRVWATWRSGQSASSREHRQAVRTAVNYRRVARAARWSRPFLRLRLLLSHGG